MDSDMMKRCPWCRRWRIDGKIRPECKELYDLHNKLIRTGNRLYRHAIEVKVKELRAE